MGTAPSEELFPRPRSVKSVSWKRALGRSYCQSRKARAGYAVFLEKGAASLARLASDAKRKLLPY